MEQDQIKATDPVQERHAFDLVISASQGNLQAINELLEYYSSRIHRLCIRLTEGNYGRWEGNYKDSDDLEQQVNLQIVAALLKAQQQFNSEEHFGWWVKKIAHNVCVDGWERSNREAAKRDGRPVEDFGNVAAKSPSKANHISEEWLAVLPEIERRIVILKFAEGYSTRDIAEILGTNHTWVARRLKKALDSLRPVLEADGRQG